MQPNPGAAIGRAGRDAAPVLPEDQAAALFLALDVAQARGEYARAAELQRALADLGWVVTRRRPPLPAHPAVPESRRTPHGPRHEAAGREGDRA